jgi:hypothetical protein
MFAAEKLSDPYAAASVKPDGITLPGAIRRCRSRVRLSEYMNSPPSAEWRPITNSSSVTGPEREAAGTRTR